MAGQPLSRLGTNGNYFLGTETLSSSYIRHLTSLALTAIAGWSSVQAQLGVVFCRLIGAKTPATMSMYAAFDSFLIQRRLLTTAAADAFPARYMRVFNATLTVLERAAVERHRFAHWTWGTSADPKFSTKILLLVDPRHLWNLNAARYRNTRRLKPSGGLTAHVTIYPALDQKLIVAYTEDDLRRVCQHMESAWQYASALERLSGPTSAVRRAIYDRLVAQPEIRQALDKEHPPKPKSKKLLPKPPRVSRRARREAALAKRQRKEET